MNTIKSIIAAIKRLFSKPSSEMLALQEMEDAKRELLHAQSTKELYESYVAYHQKRIARLGSLLGTK